MEDLLSIFKHVEDLDAKLDEHSNAFLTKLHAMLQCPLPSLSSATATAIKADQTAGLVSPQQTKKRAKRLTSLQEDEETIQHEKVRTSKSNSSKNSSKDAELLECLDAMEQDDDELPLTVPLAAPRKIVPVVEPTNNINAELPAPAVEEHEFARPQRAAKLKSEKNLKEPSLNKKLRRPSNMDDTLTRIQVKLEHENRPSQMHSTSTEPMLSKQSTASIASIDSSLVIVPGKAPSIVDIVSETEQEEGDVLNPTKSKKNSDGGNSQNGDRQLRIKIKREKQSASSGEINVMEAPKEMKQEKLPLPKKDVKNEPDADQLSELQPNGTANITSSTNTTITDANATKKGKKKKAPHRPIKVERFSDLMPQPSPISSRTRQGSVGRTQRQPSVYEDAVEEMPTACNEILSELTESAATPPTRYSQVPKNVAAAAGVNETVTVAPSNVTMVLSNNDATFKVDAANPNATVTLNKDALPGCDATFNVSQERQQETARRSPSKDNQSMMTARDTSKNDSLITEDESFEHRAVANLPPPATNKIPTSAKAYKMPTRTHELFNPLVQSPVKKKVEAFEELGKPGRPKRTKENALPVTHSSNITPTIGKLAGPALGRFLTPTQSSNIATATQVKKLASSASKAMPFPKSSSSSNLKGSTSSLTSSAKATLSRENSTEDFRRLAEERKKQREQKHLLAAQQREAKEKERAERMAKVAKEREEKRLKKQMEQEQKKKQLEEINRKLKQQEQDNDLLKKAQAQAARAATSKAIQEQERELLQQMKPPKARAPVPLPPKFETKYTFEMLHEDDSTDDEEKVTYKRPAPPSWSRNHMRNASIYMQQYWPTSIIDSFYSVQPMTPDLRLIFPNIDARHLKRNSSVFWSTPPRYSELPKY